MPPRTDFPTLCTLVDTGERRHPGYGEIYFWRDEKQGDLVQGPFRASTKSSYSRGPEHFAIYKVLGEEGADDA